MPTRGAGCGGRADGRSLITKALNIDVIGGDAVKLPQEVLAVPSISPPPHPPPPHRAGGIYPLFEYVDGDCIVGRIVTGGSIECKTIIKESMEEGIGPYRETLLEQQQEDTEKRLGSLVDVVAEGTQSNDFNLGV